MSTTSVSLSLRRFDPVTPASGPPVLLIHGFASDGWSDWVEPGWPESLTGAGRALLVPDLPGHGRSAAPNDRGDALPSTIARKLAEVIAAEPTGPVDVVGYSLGARLAWELPTTPGVDVAHLVLGGISPTEPFAAADPARIMRYAESGETPEDPLTAAIVGMVTGDGKDPRALVTCVDGLGSEPFQPQPGQLAVPTLFVAGEHDAMTDGIDDLAEMIPGASLRWVPGDHTATLRSAQFRHMAASFIGAR